MTNANAHVLVVGAGIVGSSIAQRLARRGWPVTLIDQYPPGHVRSASGGASRVLQYAFGAEDDVTRSAWSARSLWRDVEQEISAELFVEVGCMAFVQHDSEWDLAGERVMREMEIPLERIPAAEAARYFPDVNVEDCSHVLYQPAAGVLRARDAVRAMAADAIANGARFLGGWAQPRGAGLELDGRELEADHVVWACGAWAKRLFPELLAGETVQHDIFYFGAPITWATPSTPAWIDRAGELWGMGDFDGRGVKVGAFFDGPVIDPDTSPRIFDPDQHALAQRAIAHRFPQLASAPLVGAEVCHSTGLSEINANPIAVIGDARVLAHPEHLHMWLVGEGSGSLFAHGPNIAREVERLLGNHLGVD
jgi:glycine/D-amino acid oxidase-like deaminating enzyme